jgi:hypothetical protein
MQTKGLSIIWPDFEHPGVENRMDGTWGRANYTKTKLLAGKNFPKSALKERRVKASNREKTLLKTN